MKYLILSTLMMLSSMLAFSQNIKINYKGEIKPYTFKIEKAEVKNDDTVFTIKVKQQERFSYNISFQDCWLSFGNSSDEIKGSLKSWNDNKKIGSFPKPISDQKDEIFTLSFPGTDILYADEFNIKIGNIQDRLKTELIFNNIKLKKK